MPDRIIEQMNKWGKSQKNEDFRNKLEFLDCLKQKYSWENDDLDLGYVRVKEELRFQECAWCPMSNLIIERYRHHRYL
eukprot:881922-Ditylum_brightwellii.AAC.1